MAGAAFRYFVHLGLRLRGRGSVWELSKGLGCCGARGCGPPISRGRRRTLEMQVLKWWQAQYFVHLGLRLRGRGSVGSHLAWQAQHFGQASAEIVAGAVLRAGVLSRARLWDPISRGNCSALEVQVLKSWQAQYFAHLGLRLRGRGSIWELSKERAGVLSRARLWAPILRGTRSTLERQVLKSWQAQYLVRLDLRLRGRGSIWELSKGLGCCRARGCGPPSRVAGAALWRCKC